MNLPINYNNDSLLKISGYMVDLYKLARMFKNTNSHCVIEYSGQSHTVTTTKYLMNNGDKLRYYTSLEIYQRCIFVNKLIN